VVVGAGPVGTAVARALVERGEEVRLITRSGSGPPLPGIERLATDATNADELIRHTQGAETLFNCGGPASYDLWITEWPLLGSSLIKTAQETGAALLTTGNLYGYGQPSGPMKEGDPDRPNSAKGRLRAKLWADALAAHREGRIRTAEVRSSDYLGGGVASFFTIAALPRVLMNKATQVPADLDAPHSWTHIGDVARTLSAVATRQDAWGRIWHAPTPPPVSIRDLAARAAAIAGVPEPKLRSMPPAVLWAAGLFNKQAREIRELQYQFRRPFVLDSSQTEEAFGIEPLPTDEALAETIRGSER
jgi:nucleoside-diphosphate-sugar epimerase